MIGKIKKTIVNTLNNRIIRDADSFAPLQGELAEKGYAVLKDFFPENEVKLLDEVERSLSESKESHSILKDYPFLGRPLLDNRVIQIVQDYLGADAVFDYASARRFLASGPKSDTWHHDSVGHRIKIFLCLNNQDDSTHTKVIPNTHKIRYENYSDSRISTEFVRNQGEILDVIGEKNDLIVFDTNLLHLGVYSSKPRSIVQYEFSDKKKTKIKGHIGARNCRFSEDLLDSPLLYQEKVRKENGHAFYP